MTLQDTFYIIGIIYMIISLILIFAVVAALLVVRAKVVSLEHMVKEKIDAITSLPSHVSEVIETVKNFTRHKK